MGADDDAIAAAGVGSAVTLTLPREEVGQLGREPLEILRRGEAEFGVHREGQEAAALTLGTRLHARNLAHDVASRVDQVFGGEAVLSCRVNRAPSPPTHHRGIDDERLRAGGENALDTAPALPRFDELEQAGILEGAEVVVHALPPHRQFGGELGGRCGLAQPLEEPPAHRRQGGAHAVGILDKGDRRSRHRSHGRLGKLICQYFPAFAHHMRR